MLEEILKSESKEVSGARDEKILKTLLQCLLSWVERRISKHFKWEKGMRQFIPKNVQICSFNANGEWAAVLGKETDGELVE